MTNGTLVDLSRSQHRRRKMRMIRSIRIALALQTERGVAIPAYGTRPPIEVVRRVELNPGLVRGNAHPASACTMFDIRNRHHALPLSPDHREAVVKAILV